MSAVGNVIYYMTLEDYFVLMLTSYMQHKSK